MNELFPRYLRIIAVLILLLGSPVPGSAAGPPGGQGKVKAKMASVYSAFRELQPYIADEESFEASENSDQILSLIDSLRKNFHSDSLENSRYSEDPGFSTTLEVLADMLDDARHRFSEGRKSYALWRMKTVTNYCVTCHTRHSVKFDFVDDSTLKGLDAFEQAEVYLASRQFEKAAKAFLEVVSDPSLRHRRMDALRKWLIVYTRVRPAPQEAIRELSRIQGRGDLARHEGQEISDWLISLRRWANEKPSTVKPVRRAENLIRQGMGLGDPISGLHGSVELLRATAILHKVLDGTKGLQGAGRAKVLYLLGLAYGELPFFFVNELPELFLEQAIKEDPGTREAQRAYALYRKLVLLGFTGSAGTRIPDDVELGLQELHDIAFGVTQFREQV